jgi:hypothetical protein
MMEDAVPMKQDTVKNISPEKAVTVGNRATQDNGRVRIGTVSPTFPSVRGDTPATLADSGQVRMGTVSPTFPPVRTR